MLRRCVYFVGVALLMAFVYRLFAMRTRMTLPGYEGFQATEKGNVYMGQSLLCQWSTNIVCTYFTPAN